MKTRAKRKRPKSNGYRPVTDRVMATGRHVYPAYCHSDGAVPSRHRSRVTNGKSLLQGIDGRSAEYRRFKDLYIGYLERTGGKHDELCRQLAALVMHRELLDARVVNGEHVDMFHHVRLSNSINRTMRALGFLRQDDDEPPPAPIRDRLQEGAS